MQRIFCLKRSRKSIADAVFFGKRESRGKGRKFAETGNTHVHVAESTVFTAREAPERAEKSSLCFHKMIIEYCNLASGVL